jgi:hypothetical protein
MQSEGGTIEGYQNGSLQKSRNTGKTNWSIGQIDIGTSAGGNTCKTFQEGIIWMSDVDVPAIQNEQRSFYN